MEERPLKLFQISDTHLFENLDQTLLGVNTQESFDALLKLLQNYSNDLDLILLSGDLTQDASPVAYRRIAECLQPFDLPVYYVPGNHDDLEIMSKIYPYGNIHTQQSIILKQWQIILLDSHKPHAVEGYITKDQFENLRNALETYPEHHAMIVFHHQPVPVGSGWLDKNGLTNADELWHFLKKYPQVRTILFGHVHQEHEGRKNGISYYSAPSTCIQFKPGAEHFALDNLAPGFRWVELYPNGQLNTGIHRLSKYIGKFDANAKGY